jgi:hypothetical protein
VRSAEWEWELDVAGSAMCGQWLVAGTATPDSGTWLFAHDLECQVTGTAFALVSGCETRQSARPDFSVRGVVHQSCQTAGTGSGRAPPGRTAVQIGRKRRRQLRRRVPRQVAEGLLRQGQYRGRRGLGKLGLVQDLCFAGASERCRRPASHRGSRRVGGNRHGLGKNRLSAAAGQGVVSAREHSALSTQHSALVRVLSRAALPASPCSFWTAATACRCGAPRRTRR